MRVYTALQVGLGPLLRATYRMRVSGRSHVPTGGVVVAANHESLLDPFFLAAAFDRQVRFLTKEELWGNPIFAWGLDATGCIAIGRGRGDRDAVNAAARALESGDAIAVFPQGTTIPHRERPWLRGAARLALVTGAPILPVALVHTEKALRPTKVRIGFPAVCVVIGEPIAVEPTRPTIANAKELTARVRKTVERLREPFGQPAHAWLD